MELSPKDITAVIIQYKRPLDRILEHLKSEGFEDIIVWDNTKENKIVYGRYLATRRAKNNIIYTQDDDCIVQNVKEVIQNFTGNTIANGLKAEAIESYRDRNHTLVGWGSVWDRRWINFDWYLEKYGEDNILHTDADRLFTANLPKPYNTILAQIEEFPTSTDSSVAMSLQPGYFENTKEALKRYENRFGN